MTNPNSLAAFLLKKKTLAAPKPESPQPAATAIEPPSMTEQVELANDEESIVDTETEVVTPVFESDMTIADTTLRVPERTLSTPKPVKVSNVLSRDILRSKAAAMTLESVSQLTGDEVEEGVTESEFQQVLDILDAKMMADKGIVDEFNLSDFRSIIARIMIDLKANPSYAGLMLDQHTHAIMTFMWQTQVKATENNVKKEVAAGKKKESVKKKTGLALAFNKISADNLSL